MAGSPSAAVAAMAPPACITRRRVTGSRACLVLSVIVSSQIQRFVAARPICSAGLQPGVARGIGAGIVGVEIDEAALDLPIANLEHVAPAPGAVLGDAGAPLAVLVLAVAGAFADHEITAGKDPVEVRVMMLDRFDGAADIAEQFADLV